MVLIGLREALIAAVALACIGCSGQDRPARWMPQQGDRVEDVRRMLHEHGHPFEESVLYGPGWGDIVFTVGDTKYRAVYSYERMVLETAPRVYNPLLGRQTRVYR